jgi:Uma2 family endonuclease
MHGLGKAGPEAHSKLSQYSTLVPDIVFIRAEKLNQITDSDKPVPFAPDLVVEIISPSNSNDEMQEKLDLYFAAGTQTVWLVYPKRKEVVAYHANGTWQALNGKAVLTDDLLPGLSIALEALFAPTKQVSGGSP